MESVIKHSKQKVSSNKTFNDQKKVGSLISDFFLNYALLIVNGYSIKYRVSNYSLVSKNEKRKKSDLKIVVKSVV